MKRTLLAAIVLTMSSSLWSSRVIAQVGAVSGGIARQTTRQISDAIATRISRSEAAATATEQGERGLSIWYSFAYNHASGDFGVDLADIDADAYQSIVGWDRALGSFYLGVALSYIRAEFDGSFCPDFGGGSGIIPNSAVPGTGGGLGPGAIRQASSCPKGSPGEPDFVVRSRIDFSFDANGYTISPFAAWIANEHIFINFLAGYDLIDPGDVKLRRGDDRSGLTLTDTHTGFYEIDLNGVWAGDTGSVTGFSGTTHTRSIEATGRAGFRHEFSWFSGTLDHFYTFTVGGDLGIRIGIVKPYVRAWYEGTAENRFSMDHAGFAGGGVAVDITDDVILDVGGWTNFGDSHIDNAQASLSLRVKF